MNAPTTLRLPSLVALTLLLVPGLHSAQRASIDGARPVPGADSCASNVTPSEAAQILALQARGMYELAEPQEYVLTVPLTFHVVRRNNGSGGLNTAQLDQNIPVLNANYLSAGIQFTRPGAVNVILSDFFFDQITTQAGVDALRQTSPVANTINVYFVDQFHTDGNDPDPTWLCGQASFTSSPVQGIVMNYGCTSSAGNPSTFTHEIGHYFDLFHTHETAMGAECPSGSNCLTAGDLLCDTPADPELDEDNTSGCTYIGTAIRCGQFFNPQMENFMSYADKPCRTFFTGGQQARALATLVNLRPNLLGTQVSGVVWVDWGYTGFEFGTYSFPFNTLSEGLAIAPSGATVVIKGGATSGTITINQDVTLDAFRGTATIGN